MLSPMAEQIKITINLNASQQTPAAIPKVCTPKPPFDLRKITSAILLTLGLICGLLYFTQPLTAQSLEPSDKPAKQAESLQRPTATAQQQSNKIASDNSSSQKLVAKSTPSSTTTRRQTEEPTADSTKLTLVTAEPVSQAKQSTDDHLLSSTEQLANPNKPAPTTPGISEQATLTEPALTNNELERSHQPALKQSWFNQHLIRAQLTSNIKQREPLDQLDGVDLSKLNKLYLFVELQQMQGKTVEVRWYNEQQQQASVELAIGGPRWRTYASKQFDSRSRGQWRVAIFQQHQLIFEQYFKVQ